MSVFAYGSTNEANLMKVLYGKFQEKQFNKANVLFARSKKNEMFEGSQIEFPVEQSIGGGVSSGALPVAATNKISKAIITSNKLYALALIDRETMKASRSDKGSFIRATKYPVKVATQAMHRNVERQITRNDVAGAGILITGNASNSVVTGAGTSGSPYAVDFDVASTYFPAEFEGIEVGDSLNVNSETTALEVSDISVTDASGYATGTISLVGTSARLAVLAACCGTAFGGSDSLYMQESKDNELAGIKGAISATSGTLFNITVGRRWQAYQKSAASAAISTDLLNDVMLNVKRKSGESPNLILMHFHQYIKFLNLLEDQKTYNLPARDKKFKGQVSFSAIEFMSVDGPVPVIPSRFIDSDKVYFLNDNYLELHLRPGGISWDDDFGSVFMRKDSADQYEGRYAGYGEYFTNPHFQGYLHTLAV